MAEMSSRVKAEFERLKASDSRLAAMRKRLETSSDLSAVSEYSRRLAELTRQAIESRTDPGELDITEAQKILDELLRDNYNEVNTLCEEVQRRADKKAGIGLNPQRADYPAERVRTVAGAAAFAKTDEQKVRRLASPAENITESFHSDYVQTNAEYRSSAGLDAYIVRTDGAGCCKWCAALAGKFKYPDEIPDDIFRRHDNCTCDVSYVSSKGRQNVHTKKWTNEPRKIEYTKPTKLTREQAEVFERENSKIKSDNPETIVARKNILSPEYRRHFNEFGENSNVTSVMCSKTREMLSHRTGTLYEDMVFIDSTTGRCKIQNNYNVEQKVIPTMSMKKMVNESPPYTIIAIHNHPHSSVPSIDDLDSCYKHKYKYGVIACHNGNAFKYSVKGEYDKEYADMLLDNLNKIVYNKENLGKDFDKKLNDKIEELRINNIEMEVFLWA